MNKYQRGKIYKIISSQTDKVYVGSTINKYLSNRIAAHRSYLVQFSEGNKCYRYTSSFELLQYDDARIILLEEYPCQRREQLLAREQRWIDNTVNCVNTKKCSSGLTKAEYKRKTDRVYRLKHDQQIKDRRSKCFSSVCGGHYTYGHKTRHFESRQHHWMITVQ